MSLIPLLPKKKSNTSVGSGQGSSGNLIPLLTKNTKKKTQVSPLENILRFNPQQRIGKQFFGREPIKTFTPRPSRLEFNVDAPRSKPMTINERLNLGLGPVNAQVGDIGQRIQKNVVLGRPSTVGILPDSGQRRFTKVEDKRKRKEQEDMSAIEVFTESLRGGTLAAGSALGSTAGVLTKKIYKEIGQKLLDTANSDQKLSTVVKGIDIHDGQTFMNKIRDPKWTARGLGQNLPNLAASYGIGLATLPVGGPFVAGAVAFGTSASLEGGFAYQDAKAFGADDETAEKVMLMVGIANGLIDTIPIGKALTRSPIGKKMKRSILKEVTQRILKQGALESGTESLQEIVANVVAQVYDENRDVLAGVGEAAFFGFLLGGPAGLTTDTVRSEQAKDFVKSQTSENRAGFAKIPFVKDENTSKSLMIKNEVSNQKIRLIPRFIEAQKFKTAEEFINAQEVLYHGGSKIDSVKLGKSNFGKTFYLTDDATYAKSFGGNKSVVNEMVLDKSANLADMRKPSAELVSKIEEIVNAKLAKNVPYGEKNFSFHPFSTEQVLKGIKGGKAHFAELSEIKTILKKLGYDGQITAEVPFAKNIGVWNKDLIKTKSQLTDIYNKAKIPEKIAGESVPENMIEPAAPETKTPSKAEAPKAGTTITSEPQKGVEYTPVETKATARDQYNKANEKTNRVDLNEGQIKATVKERGVGGLSKKANEKTKGKFLKILQKDITAKISKKIPLLKQTNKTKDIEKIKRSLIDFIQKNLKRSDAGRKEILVKVKNAKTIRDLQQYQERILDITEKSERSSLRKDIVQEIRKTKTRSQSGKPRGKYTADVQKVFDTVRDVIKLKNVAKEARLEANLKQYENEKSVPPEVALENRILSMTSKDSASLQELLGEIRKMRLSGQMTAELRKLNTQAEIDRRRNLVVDKVTGNKGISPDRAIAAESKLTRKERAKQLFKSLGKSWVLDWQGILTALSFNSKVGDTALNRVFSVLNQENTYKESQAKYVKKLSTIISKSYGIENNKTAIQKQIIENNEEVYLGTYRWADGKTRDLVMTKDEMIKRYMEFQDPTLFSSFTEANKYTEEIMSTIEDNLTNKDKTFADKQMELYLEQYHKINKVYRIINGVDLPFNKFYSPIQRVGFRVDTSKGFGEFIQEATYRRAVTNKSLKSRVNNILPIAKQGSLEALDRHITETNYYIAWVDKIREMDSVFSDSKVREAIKQEFGKPMLETIGNVINDLSTNGNRTARTFNAIDWLRKKFTVGALMIKPAIAIKQLVSTLAYMEKLSPKEFTVGVADFLKNPIKNTRILLDESTFIQERGSNLERDIKAAVESDVYKKYSKSQNFFNTMMLNVRLGDKSAILMGAWAMRKSLLKEGKALDEVIGTYEEFSQGTQQSSDISRLSQAQRGSSLEKLFTMFKSSQRSYFQKELNAVRSLFQDGGASKKNLTRVAKTLFIYHVLLPVTFQFIANLGGFSDKDKKEYLRAGLLGSINGIFIFGDIADSILRGALGMQVWDLEIPVATIAKDVNKIMRNLRADDITTEDYMQAVDGLAGVGGSIGLPTQQALQISKGIADLLEGNARNGIGQILGWSEYALSGASDKKKESTSGLPTLPKLPSIGGEGISLPKLPKL